MSQTSEPKLDPPGAGMPLPTRWVARLLVPFQASRSNWDENLARFRRYSTQIEEIAKSLTTDQLNTRYLVTPIRGLEDSSRYWSPGMVLDHMIITGGHFHQIIADLSHQIIPPLSVRTEQVKPPVQTHELGIVQKFHKFWNEFEPTLQLGPDLLTAKLTHPWFGKLNAHQWMYVLSLHHGIHLQQLRQIRHSFTQK